MELFLLRLRMYIFELCDPPKDWTSWDSTSSRELV